MKPLVPVQAILDAAAHDAALAKVATAIEIYEAQAYPMGEEAA